MPLTLADMGQDLVILRVGGGAEVKKHLCDLGFVPGEHISVVSILSGNVIVKVKESRVAVSCEMAAKIMVRNLPNGIIDLREFSDENIEGCKGGEYCQSCEAPRRRRGKAQNYGHGNNEGRRGFRQKRGPFGRSH